MFSSTQKISKQLAALIERAQRAGLPTTDVIRAQEYLEYHEYGLCLDHIVTQLYEFDVVIDAEFYKEVEKIAAIISIPESDYSYLRQLIFDRLA